ncbi:DUF885 domain-containing protein [Subsaximicrobium wynnwilliamsii]|uniref:DUF885 domain-containing protein n=2 Tax=Subsaximicrobium wynnwilliamsii TaxID=291179 RepID=A0A5C6ZM12_9FLAO|nr:DUF885 domain-containing protein [Subsaximicrobium wynnwilliamsii]TXD85244.1 DUF885 domain-containing protein [Subsaximicrobium wynnwilliamsii]TXD91344.1 DUF885 domain-containing protein [Subsaximicrobium wynnwilliamsii]TXE04680.1 DUF885 domain-containing protein [Subsaximicrobium wynnwilliamsii]
MKHIFIACLVLLSLSACKNDKTETAEEPQKTNIQENMEFSNALDQYYEDGLQLDPLSATAAGDHRFNDQMPNYLAEDYKAKLQSYYSGYKSKINAFDDADLSESQQMSKAILNWECDINLEGLAFDQDLTPINQMWTLQLGIGQLASGAGAQPFKTVEDYQNWLKRLDGYLAWMASAEDKMKQGILSNQVLPKSLILKVLPQLEALTTNNLNAHLFYAPVLNFPKDFSEADKKQLTKAYQDKVKTEIIPAYTKLHDFMAGEYLEAGRISSGLADTPDGNAYYKHQIKRYTTTNMTADEIHELGLQEVARILTEMEKVKQQVGFEGDIMSFFDAVRNTPELMPYKTPAEIIDHFNKIHQIMQPHLEKMFDLKPNTPFEVRQTEAFREASASAEYNPGSLDGTRPGIFYVPIPDASTYNVFSSESLFLHEAIPGHHYQIALQQENKDLPKFRKTLWYSAYGEGWALYSESLGKELGLYTDPYQYFGMLSAEMHRAIRLVVDTGIHAKGWSRERAIKYSMQNEAESIAGITSEIERYMANGGQALSYKIGQLKILELRAKAEKTLGKNFNIAKFHNQVLMNGCVPLALLEDNINAWIDSERE